jgi:polyhydroxyalkanoate synthesis regulator phasin
MTNPFTIGIAGAALVAAYFINRSAKRRKEETARTDILTKSKEEVQKLIDQAKGGRLSMEDGRAQFLAIRQNYLDQVGQLTDKKTRNIAIATVRELDYQWSNVLQPLLLRSDRANELERIIVPTFGVGGQKQGDGLAYLHHREVILTQEMQRQVGVDRLRQAVPNYTPPASGGGDSGGGFSEEALEAFREMFANIKMTNVMVAGDDAADDLISRGDPNTFYSKTKLVVAKDGGKFLSAAARGMK